VANGSPSLLRTMTWRTTKRRNGVHMRDQFNNVIYAQSSTSLPSLSNLNLLEDQSFARHFDYILFILNSFLHRKEVEIVLDRRKQWRDELNNGQQPSMKRDRCRSRSSIHRWNILYLSLLVSLGIPPTIRGQDPTSEPTVEELFSDAPSAAPSETNETLTISLAPSINGATLLPTTTLYPTSLQSDLPSFAPTFSIVPSSTPSASPTVRPTFDDVMVQDARFRQKFIIGNGRVFTEAEILLFQGLYTSYTTNFANPTAVAEGLILTTCEVDAQEGLVERRLRYRQQKNSRVHDARTVSRVLQSEPIEALNVDFTMRYESRHFNVTSYPILFQGWVNVNLETVTVQMQLLQLNVTDALPASRIIIRTPAPSISTAPSDTPSFYPTQSILPSSLPTAGPSISPTAFVPPTSPPTVPSSGSNPIVVITVSILVGFAIVAIGLLIYCRKRRHTREMEYQAAAIKKKQELEVATHEGGWPPGSAPQSNDYDDSESAETPNYGSAFRQYSDGAPGIGPTSVVSPSESLVSNQSLLSAGNSMTEDSVDEADMTPIFADEFDQYKDQNLEKIRTEVEGNIEGCEGMMSQAVARALIDEDDLTFGTGDYFWGGNENVTGPEIEASALGDVMDRLKLDENASIEEK
jgi:hypothetical protein